MSNKSIVGFAMILVALAIAGYQMTNGTGPLKLERAERLLDLALLAEVNRVEVILPDGEVARALPDAISNRLAINCNKINSSLGSIPGRYGTGGRTYGGATFECLFSGESPSGTRFHFSSYVARTGETSRKGTIGGDIMLLLRSDDTKALMRKSGFQARAHSHEEQAELWAGLARDGIYVPADKSQTSPLQKAMQGHIKRLNSK